MRAGRIRTFTPGWKLPPTTEPDTFASEAQMAPKRTRVTVEAVDGGAGGREGPYVMTFAAGSAPPELSCAVFKKPGASRHATLVGHTVRVPHIPPPPASAL